MYLTRASVRRDLTTIRAQSHELARRVRRFNAPVQLALAAADEVVGALDDPAGAMLVSLAPCCGGSAEALHWAHRLVELATEGRVRDLRLNPVLTLHAVDNLALSELSIHLRNGAHCVGVGGAAGQLWPCLEDLHARMQAGTVGEALVMAADQDAPDAADTAIGAALTFSATPRPWDEGGDANGDPGDRMLRLIAVDEVPGAGATATRAHAAAGLVRLVAALRQAPVGSFEYPVPWQDGDGLGRVITRWEVT